MPEIRFLLRIGGSFPPKKWCSKKGKRKSNEKKNSFVRVIFSRKNVMIKDVCVKDEE